MQYEIKTEPFTGEVPPKDGESYDERQKRENENSANETSHELEHSIVTFYETDEDEDGNEIRGKEVASFTYDELLEKFWSEYWDENDLDPDSRPMDSGMLEDYIQSLESPTDILFRVYYGYEWSRWGDEKKEFNPNDEYFAFSGYGNLVSICEYDLTRYLSGYIGFEELVKWVADNKDETELD